MSLKNNSKVLRTCIIYEYIATFEIYKSFQTQPVLAINDKLRFSINIPFDLTYSQSKLYPLPPPRPVPTTQRHVTAFICSIVHATRPLVILKAVLQFLKMINYCITC